MNRSFGVPSFTGEYRFLSNFYPAPIKLRGVVYPTVEHAYQAGKTLDSMERAMIRNASSAAQAKKLGRRITLRADWSEIKLPLMEGCLRQKFSREPLRSQLLATGDEPLEEANYWRDTFWGICDDRGENHLGKLLMKIRSEL